MHPVIRDYAVRGLAVHRTPAAMAKLRELAEDDESPKLRDAAARAAEVIDASYSIRAGNRRCGDRERASHPPARSTTVLQPGKR